MQTLKWVLDNGKVCVDPRRLTQTFSFSQTPSRVCIRLCKLGACYRSIFLNTIQYNNIPYPPYHSISYHGLRYHTTPQADQSTSAGVDNDMQIVDVDSNKTPQEAVNRTCEQVKRDNLSTICINYDVHPRFACHYPRALTLPAGPSVTTLNHTIPYRIIPNQTKPYHTTQHHTIPCIPYHRLSLFLSSQASWSLHSPW